MFGEFLLEQGVEMELHADIGEILDLLDKEVPNFSCDELGFSLSGFNGKLRSQWKMFVKPLDREKGTVLDHPVGFIQVARLDQGLTGFKIPPRDKWRNEGAPVSELEARRYSSFIFQLLNVLQSRGLVDLPGQMPVV